MSSPLDTEVLRTLALDQLPSKLNTLRSQLSDDIITEQLLNAVESGSISTSVFAVWLGICKSPSVIRQALKQKFSVHIRHLGIAQLKRGLESPQWEELWEGLGGSSGLLEIFGDLSVREVRSACKAIGRSTRDEDILRKRIRVTELFKGFHPNVFPEATAKTDDLRPLSKFYQELVPSCTTDLVEWITSQEQKGKWRHVREKELLRYHADSLGRAASRSVFEGKPSDIKDKDRLRKLSTGFPPQRPPPGINIEERFSSSMVFALELLRHVIETGSTRLEGEWVLENLIRSLLRRAMSKRVSWSRTQEIAALTIEFLQQQPSAARRLTSNKRDVLHLIAICWSRRSALFEPQLKHLMRTVFDNQTSFEDVGNLLVGVPRSRRYALLQLSCKEAMGLDLDTGIGFPKAQGRLPVTLLNALDASDALNLFSRLRDARGDAGLVDLGLYSSVLVTTRTPDVYEGDPDIHYMVLLNRNRMFHEAEAYAVKVMETRKNNTQTASNKDRRAEHALSVWACASASGSLKLLSETVKWARRFVRDSLTAAKLFSTYYDETYRLLSGFPANDKTIPELEELRKRVDIANGIMLDLLDIACSAVREPHFQAGNWHKTLAMFTKVVKERINLSSEMTEVSSLSDEDVYLAVLADTIPMLLRVEATLIEEGYEKLGANNVSGMLDWESIFPSHDTKTWGINAWSFVDNLAKARNDMWTKSRVARNPDVLTLPEPFPRGLPVQHLFSLPSWHRGIPATLENLVPYIFSRVKEVLFVPPEVALMPVILDKSIRQAIGPFVDDYAQALTLYVPIMGNKTNRKEREQRSAEVWSHLLGPLSEQRMTREEAFEYWRSFQPRYLVDSERTPEEKRTCWPMLPRSDDPSQTQEWNPLDGQPVDVVVQKARDLGQPTYIDFCTFGMRSQSSKAGLTSTLEPPLPRISEKKQYGGSIWKYSFGPEAQEANALAALLYLDARYGSKNGLLSTPFPSMHDVRYPSVYLDEEFLRSEELDVSIAVQKACQDSAPLLLKYKVAVTLVERLMSGKDSPMLEQASLQLVAALKESDKPILAFDLALEIIIGYPKASSWHRILLDDGFLNSLPASDARNCIEKYADAIGRQLDAVRAKSEFKAKDRSSDQVESPESQTHNPDGIDQPLIKVTTLKSLAQLLNNSAYIGDGVSLEILSNLSSSISHIDVRVSILKTFLSKLEVNRPELWDYVLSALETFLPIAGSMNERQPTDHKKDGPTSLESSDSQSREQMEQGHEQSRVLPEIKLTSDPSWQEESPILSAFVESFLKIQDGRLLDLYMDRIMIPLVRILEEQTSKWTTMFLRKYAKANAEVLNLYIPPVPKGLQILENILFKTEVKSYRVPKTILDKYVRYLVFRIEPSVPVQRLNQSLEDDPILRSTTEVDTWLELYGNKSRLPWTNVLPLSKINVFESEIAEASGSSMTGQTFQEAFLKVFRALVSADSPGYKSLTAFVSNVGTSEHGIYRNTIEKMIAHVDSLRTRQWERDPNRSPAVLPDVFLWRLRLLPYPKYGRSDADSESECKVFAQQLATILDEISGSMYHEKLQQIKAQTQYTHKSMLYAIYLGDISKTRLSWLTTPDLLRVDLAAFLIATAGVSQVAGYEDRLKTLLDSWTGSENEEVRRLGYKIRGDFLLD